ncbi:LysR family transcriptional regulator [Nocardioides albus]|uniref:DNA-binding transcriptional LysR family regulator n=1 Tax=Nocardioides albus TaxID=1841 RepID=A0A7W5A0Y8_9ACTN|nr:LysR family transcriptional regulator [Nocardioides albus]MBB3087632.1 DNA-binding transcriptional LysR family regulator [Nocardioides albus]GGU10386.1 LysR family transcriptional regulator [Nocardioides albus]
MDRRHLEYFVTVAELGSFTRAAQALSIAQPSLSNAIGWLERDLDTRLFDRHGRGARLTPAGEALLEPARRSLRSFEVARGAVRAVSQAGFGRLAIITNTLWAVEPLARLVGEFRDLHPRVQVTVADPRWHGDVLETVRMGGAELGLVDGTPPGGTLASRWLADLEMMAVCPPDAESALGHEDKGSITIGDLSERGLVCTPDGTVLRGIVAEPLEAAGLSTDVAVETAHLAAVAPLVLAGAGAAVLPKAMAEDAAAKGARVQPLDPPLRRSVHVIWRKRRASDLALGFVDFCVNACATSAP